MKGDAANRRNLWPQDLGYDTCAASLLGTRPAMKTEQSLTANYDARVRRARAYDSVPVVSRHRSVSRGPA